MNRKLLELMTTEAVQYGNNKSYTFVHDLTAEKLARELLETSLIEECDHGVQVHHLESWIDNDSKMNPKLFTRLSSRTTCKAAVDYLLKDPSHQRDVITGAPGTGE